jgi:hypothetical protein
LLSEAVEKYGDAIVQLRKLEAYREIAKILAQGKKVTYIPSSNGTLFNFKLI